MNKESGGVTMSENRQFHRAIGEKINSWKYWIGKYAIELWKAGTPVLMA
ncbi:MAG TPA: hypothetical protein VFZ08_08585 [Terriglobia bacterium]|nr:hypothetical protein [Terriglobia bacterium]